MDSSCCVECFISVILCGSENLSSVANVFKIIILFYGKKVVS